MVGHCPTLHRHLVVAKHATTTRDRVADTACTNWPAAATTGLSVLDRARR